MIEETMDYSPQTAFIDAKAGYELFGEPLRKFSLSRKEAAGRMGWVNPFLRAGVADLIRAGGFYPGMQSDVRIVLWLCTLRDASEFTPEDYRAGNFHPDRALSSPEVATEKSRAWAESVGLDEVASAAFGKAYGVYLAIVLGVDASLFDVDVEKTGGPANDSPPPKATPGKPTARTVSRASRPSPGKPKATSGKK